MNKKLEKRLNELKNNYQHSCYRSKKIDKERKKRNKLAL